MTVLWLGKVFQRRDGVDALCFAVSRVQAAIECIGHQDYQELPIAVAVDMWLSQPPDVFVEKLR